MPWVLMSPLSLRCSSTFRFTTMFPASVFNWLCVVMFCNPCPVVMPFSVIRPMRFTMGGSSAFLPFRFSEMKLMVFAERSNCSIFACHLGWACLIPLIHAVKFRPTSPVVEPTASFSTATFSPFPLNADSIVSVLLNVFSEGRKQAKSDKVMVEGLILPVYFNEEMSMLSFLN